DGAARRRRPPRRWRSPPGDAARVRCETASEPKPAIPPAAPRHRGRRPAPRAGRAASAPRARRSGARLAFPGRRNGDGTCAEEPVPAVFGPSLRALLPALPVALAWAVAAPVPARAEPRAAPAAAAPGCDGDTAARLRFLEARLAADRS